MTSSVGSRPEEDLTLSEVWGELFGSVIGPLLGLYAAMILLTLLIQYVYHVELMFRSGQTVGKRVMKLQVVTLDPAGSVTRTVATKRWLVESVAATFIPGFDLSGRAVATVGQAVPAVPARQVRRHDRR